MRIYVIQPKDLVIQIYILQSIQPEWGLFLFGINPDPEKGGGHELPAGANLQSQFVVYQITDTVGIMQGFEEFLSRLVVHLDQLTKHIGMLDHL